MPIGYARVSTADQDLTLQADALTEAGCEGLFTDKASGAKADRPRLAEALRFARVGDTLAIRKLDRLGLSIQGLIELAADLSARKIDFRSLTDGFTMLYRSTDCRCRRGAPMLNLAHSASFHSREKTAPSTPGIKHLVSIDKREMQTLQHW